MTNHKPKVVIYIQNGMIKTINSNVEMEVMVLEEDSNSGIATKFEEQHVQIQENFEQMKYDSWKRSLEENHFPWSDEVHVIPKDGFPKYEFVGLAEGKIKQDTDGSYYVGVVDQNENRFDVDIMQISITC